MSETPVRYLLKPESNSVTLSTEMDVLLAHLADLERQLTSLLITVQRAQGKEPTVMTRGERRRG